MALGFIGTGALTSAIVTGLRSSGQPCVPIWLSPRNRTIAGDLAARYDDVHVAADNQAVVDNCTTVFIALRPTVVSDVLRVMRFRAEQHVISLVTMASLEEIAALVLPARRVTKALPIPAVAYRQGATIVHPPDREVAQLFSPLGEVVDVASAAEFKTLSVATATFATYFKYLETIEGWLTAQGIEGPKARRYLAALFKGLASGPEHANDESFAQLASHYATPGGLNEQVLGEFESHRAFDVLFAALDRVRDRIA